MQNTTEESTKNPAVYDETPVTRRNRKSRPSRDRVYRKYSPAGSNSYQEVEQRHSQTRENSNCHGENHSTGSSDSNVEDEWGNEGQKSTAVGHGQK